MIHRSPIINNEIHGRLIENILATLVYALFILTVATMRVTHMQMPKQTILDSATGSIIAIVIAVSLNR